MARDFSGNLEICPFWSMQAMKCQLCQEGLFIPLNDHIEVYCNTLHYPQCRQYSLQANHLPPRENHRQNRRRYDRVATSHRVTLVELVQTKRSASHLATAHVTVICGSTLNLGKGGMCLTTEQPLTKAGTFRFSFENSFPKSIQIGQGHIAWCNKQSKLPAYQAGIAFQDNRLIDTMGLYLGLIASFSPSAD